MSLLAIDIGSSACKAVAFSVEGKILARHGYSYTPDFPRLGYAEMHPERFWDAVRVCSQETVKAIAEPVQAVCLSSHGETFIPLSLRDEPLGPAFLNQDNRAIEETKWIEKQVGRKRLFEITGLALHTMYPLPKILWLRKHQPELFTSRAKFVTVIGFILTRLGLEPYADFSLASRYLAFDIRKHCWSNDLLSLFDLTPENLPVAKAAGAILGKLSADSATALGLAAGTPVVLGGHDQPCGALGMGVIGPKHVADSIGTYECLLAVSDNPVLTDAALAGSLNSYCHVIPDKYATIAFFPSGIMLKWFHNLLYQDCGSQESEHYALLESQSANGPTGLCITPDLIGTCNPDFNPNTRSVIFGLNAGTSRADLYKGILEGLACEFSAMTTLVQKAVGDFDDVHVAGGGSRSTLGLKLRAALAGKRLHMMQCQEAVCLGGAILAGVATGEYSNIDEAVRVVVRQTGTTDPDPAIATAYGKQISRYQSLRSALQPIQNS